jgi:hypothetical protein
VSDEFTSIFTENRSLAPHLGLVEANQEVVEQTVEVDTTVEMDSSMFIQEFEVIKRMSRDENLFMMNKRVIMRGGDEWQHVHLGV